ncbi:MAG: SsrA-binding protein SmpB [Flavobacteriaceae bacterium]|nr:SsrA-binding protein SmpB [Flavobacteriaceae bacterium]
MKSSVVILNKRARFEYEILSVYTAGIVLTGSEIKSIRLRQASIIESFCEFNKSQELFIINMQIEPYQYAHNFSHKPKSARKLLLNRKELRVLHRKVITKGNTIVPLKLFINNRGLAKLDIALAKGKKLHDKRQDIKERENKRNLDRIQKQHQSHR